MKLPVTYKTQGLLFLTLLPLVVLSSCSKKEGPRQPPPMSVAVISTKAEQVRITSTLPGRISAIKDAEVRARVDGIVQSIHFEQGSKVTEGQLLFKIDPAVYQANLNAAQALLNQAQANARSASSLANRYASLVKSNAISKQEYDNAMASSSQSRATVDAAKAALDSAKINLSYTDVVSPIDGIINRNLVTEGALVSAMGATPMAKVLQFDEVYVDFTQSATELNHLRRALASGELERADDGESASVSLELDDGSLYEHKGKLLFSGISVDPATGKVNLRAIFPNKDHYLLPGMFVRVQIMRGINRNAILIPTQALQRRSDGTSNVYIVHEGKVEVSPVKEAEVVGSRTIITSGLQVGDQLIVEGFSKIGPGMPVKAVAWSKDPDAAKTAAVPAEPVNAEKSTPSTSATKSAPSEEQGRPEAQPEATKAN